jgi:DNA-binding winged helix-turn-helix (wHTH) protein
LLSALVVESRSLEPTPLSTAQLIELAWPDERIADAAAANRLYVAINALRRLGLRGVLIRRGAGYLLDPQVPIIEGYRLRTVVEQR